MSEGNYGETFEAAEAQRAAKAQEAAEAAEATETIETPEEPSEMDEEIDSDYEDYLDEDKAQKFEYKSSAEKEAEARKEIEEASPYSKEITDNIRSKEELDIYVDEGLKEETVNGRPCLTRSDISMETKDEFGTTNSERIADGKSPINNDGKTVELHHVGQKNDSPFAELPKDAHRGKENDTVLHDKTQTSEIDRSAYNAERKAHWSARANNM